MAQWTDITGYAQGDRARGREPDTWAIKRGGFSVTVTRGHIAARGKWVMHARPFFDAYDLGLPGTAPAEDAQKKAIGHVRSKLSKALDGFADVLA